MTREQVEAVLNGRGQIRATTGRKPRTRHLLVGAPAPESGAVSGNTLCGRWPSRTHPDDMEIVCGDSRVHYLGVLEYGDGSYRDMGYCVPYICSRCWSRAYTDARKAGRI